MHLFRIASFDEIGRVAIAAEQVFQLLMTDASENAGIGDLVAIEVEDRQNHAVGRWVQEFVGMPARRHRPGLGFAIADDTGNYQVRVVESRSVGMRECIPELAALVNRTGCFRRHVTRYAAGERELREQPLHALFIEGNVRVDLAVSPVEIRVRNQSGSAMTGAGDVDHVEVVLLDHAVQMNVDEIQSRRRSPVTEESRLDVLLCEGLLEQRVVIKIDLAHRQVIGGPPVRIHQ